MKKMLFVFALGILCLSLSGCWFLIGGAAGAGAYYVSKDTAQGDVEKSYESLWRSASDTAKRRGVIQAQDALAGTMEVGSQGSLVWIKISRLTKNTSHLKVSARKSHVANLDLAQSFYSEILGGAR